MAIPVNIEDLLSGQIVESTRVEFKAGYNPQAIVHTICAFANDIDNIGGGYVVIGVEEDGGAPAANPAGLAREEVDAIMKKLVGLRRRIEPLYQPIAEPVEFRGALLIAIWCPGGHGRPYKAPGDLAAKRPAKHHYIRKFASTVIASPDEEKELFYISSSIPFDDRPCLAAPVEALSRGLMLEHLDRVKSPLADMADSMATRTIAENMQLLSGPPEAEHPRNVGVLMFSEHPEEYFPHARIEVVDIPDPTGSGMTERLFTGPIQRQLSDTLMHLRNMVIAERIEKPESEAESIRIFNYPFAAVEEILANAVYHRSYQVPEPITVRITPQALEITSFPGFARSITDAAIASGDIRGRFYRNRRIGDFLKELRLIEGRNTGFPRAFAALEANGSPALRFEMDEERSFLAVTIPAHPAFSSPTEPRISAYDARIEEALAGQTLTLTQLARAMGYKGISKRLRTRVDELLASKTLAADLTAEGRAGIRWAARRQD